MSLIQGLPGFIGPNTSTGTDPGLGLSFTRSKGPGMAGQVADNTPGGPIPQAGGFICIQSTASLTNQIVTTSATTVNNRASFFYIPVTTGPLQGAGAPPYVGVGAALVWDDTSRRLEVWST